ncbi:MAG: hypothetical protein MUQ56_04125 [Thermoleophilia bacterium]|nr:hypothetical protein [Thermoleophilia bacterium]
MAERQPKRVHALVIGDTWAWPAGNRTMVLFSKILGGRLGRSLILRYNLFARVIVPGGVKRHTMSDAVRLHYTSQFPDRESRIPTAVFPREILGSRAYLERVERDLPTRYSAGSLPHSSDLAPAAGFESPLPPVAPARAE